MFKRMIDLADFKVIPCEEGLVRVIHGKFFFGDFYWLISNGKWETEALAEYLCYPDIKVRRKVAEALGETRDARAVEPLISALHDENSGVRSYAAWALGKINDARAVMYLIAALNDYSWDVRQNAAQALGNIGDIRAVEPLINTLDDESDDVRFRVAWALGKIGDSRAIKPLSKMLNHHNVLVVNAATQALEQIKSVVQ